MIFLGCCASSYWWVGWVSRSGMMGDVENMRFGDLHPPLASGFSGGVRLLVLLGGCNCCL